MRDKIFAYADERYGTKPEYLWKRDPDAAVLRNRRNRKWYAVFMRVSRQRLGLEGTGDVDVMDVKIDPDLAAVLVQAEGFLLGYHMNKRSWLTLCLDGSCDIEELKRRLNISYNLALKSKYNVK